MRKDQSQNGRKRTTAIRVGLIVFFVFLFLMPMHPAMAQLASDATNQLGAASGLSTQNIAVYIANIIRIFLGILGIVLTVIVLYAGYLYMLSQGDAAKIAKAKKIIQAAIIGLVIIFSSYAIVTFILNALLGATGFGGVQTTTAEHSSEPLSGSLGGGIIESHYPARDAIDIPRNTNIMITFKEGMDPGSFMKEADGTDYDATLDSTKYLNADNILIFPNAETDTDTSTTTSGVPLATGDVVVSMTTDGKTFVFNPSPLLGSAIDNTSYTVQLKNTILAADGSAAFSGSESDGYEWTFQVSTTVDLTPPKVESVVPDAGGTFDRNITVSITFNEAMDPVAASGIYGTLSDGTAGTFSHVEVLNGTSNVVGTYSVTNNYQTIEFQPDEACGSDPCGDTIYCLPGSADTTVQAHAASVGADAPQATITAGQYDGLVDAAGNALDGDGDGIAEGSTTDDYDWGFTTSDAINDDPPEIYSITPTIHQSNVGIDTPVEVTFTLHTGDASASLLMQSSSLNSTNMQIIADTPNESGELQDLWFSIGSESTDVDVGGTTETLTKATINHAAFWQTIDGVDLDGTYYRYYPLIARGVKSAYQICMYPAADAGVSGSSCSSRSSDTASPWCCDGSVSGVDCSTVGGSTLGQ